MNPGSIIEAEVHVRRTAQGLGVVVSPNNIILEMAPGGPAEEDGKLKVGDVVVGIDGVKLVDAQGRMVTKLKDQMAKLTQRNAHHFLIQRHNGEASARDMPDSVRANPAPLAFEEEDDDLTTTIVPPAPPRAPLEMMTPAPEVPARPRPVPAGRGADALLMVLLAPDGARYKQYVQLNAVSSASSLMDIASEAWEAACQKESRGLRLEGLQHTGDRLMLTLNTPMTALRGVAELRVSCPGLIPTAALTGRPDGQENHINEKQLVPRHVKADYVDIVASKPVEGETYASWSDEAGAAGDAAFARSALEAVATTPVLQELLDDLSASNSTPDEKAALANSGNGTSVLPPALLSAMRPRLAIALQRAAALAIKSAEDRAEAYLKEAITAERNRHQNEVDSLRQAANASTERERTMAVEKALSVSQKQEQERHAAAVDASRRDERTRLEPEKKAAVAAALELAGRRAETAKKQAIDSALAAAEKQAAAKLSRSIEAAEEKIAAKFSAGINAAERAHEARLASAMAQIEALKVDAKEAEVKASARLKEARDECELMREQLERADNLQAQAERAGQAKAASAYSAQQQQVEAARHQEMVDTLKRYESRAERAKTEAVAASEAELQKKFARERLELLEKVEQSKVLIEEARERAHRQGMEAGRQMAMKEMNEQQVKAAVAARAEAAARMQERAQADVAKTLAAAQQRAADLAVQPVITDGSAASITSAPSMLPGVAEAIAAAEAAAKERTIKATEAVVKAASSKWSRSLDEDIPVTAA
jgi:hypothetical protein